ncbi:MAG: hypothetical protein ACK49H_06365 [Burkholderiales bacterium]
MNRFIWLIALVAIIGFQAREHDPRFAVGWTLPWFLIGLALSPVVWLLTRRKRIEPWRWYDWANAGAVMMLVAMVLGLVIRGYMPTP